MTALPLEIFKAYDIRGIVCKTLTREIVTAIGSAVMVTQPYPPTITA